MQALLASLLRRDFQGNCRPRIGSEIQISPLQAPLLRGHSWLDFEVRPPQQIRKAFAREEDHGEETSAEGKKQMLTGDRVKVGRRQKPMWGPWGVHCQVTGA